MKTRLGKQETQFLAYLQIGKKRIVKAGELTGPLHLTPRPRGRAFPRIIGEIS